MSILISIFISGYHGKTTDFAKNSSCHRTTIAHFLNSGKWDDSLLSDTLKCSVIEIIYSEAARTGKPVFCIVDDTIASKTKPSSQALHPIEDAYFHQSHLKGKQDYGHQAVAVMLSCNGIVLNYAFVMYNKSISKIDIVQSIAKELPVPPVMSYFLCDCWYVSEKIILDYSRRSRESGWKPHSYYILIEYCFSLIKWIKKEHPFVVKLRCSKPLIIQTKEPFMSIVNTLSLESNRQIKINFISDFWLSA